MRAKIGSISSNSSIDAKPRTSLTGTESARRPRSAPNAVDALPLAQRPPRPRIAVTTIGRAAQVQVDRRHGSCAAPPRCAPAPARRCRSSARRPAAGGVVAMAARIQRSGVESRGRGSTRSSRRRRAVAMDQRPERASVTSCIGARGQERRGPFRSAVNCVCGAMAGNVLRPARAEGPQRRVDVRLGVEDVCERRMPLNHCFSTILTITPCRSRSAVLTRALSTGAGSLAATSAVAIGTGGGPTTSASGSTPGRRRRDRAAPGCGARRRPRPRASSASMRREARRQREAADADRVADDAAGFPLHQLDAGRVAAHVQQALPLAPSAICGRPWHRRGSRAP